MISPLCPGPGVCSAIIGDRLALLSPQSRDCGPAGHELFAARAHPPAARPLADLARQTCHRAGMTVHFAPPPRARRTRTLPRIGRTLPIAPEHALTGDVPSSAAISMPRARDGASTRSPRVVAAELRCCCTKVTLARAHETIAALVRFSSR